MIIYDHEPLFLNSMYEYERIRYARPYMFKPSYVSPGTYDIIIKEGQELPITNLFARTSVNAPGLRTGPNYQMTLETFNDPDIGEYTEMVITKDGLPVQGVEVRPYYAGSNHMILPVYLSDSDGKVVLYLQQGEYDFYLRATLYEPKTPDYCDKYCKPYNPYKNFARIINNVVIPEGIKEADLLLSSDRIPVVRYLRRVNSSLNPCRRQGNMMEEVRYDRRYDFVSSVFEGAFTRIFGEDGNLVYISKVDAEGKVAVWLDEGKKYVMYHDKKDFDTVYELLDTTYSIMGRMGDAPLEPDVKVMPHLSTGMTIRILSQQRKRGDIVMMFDYEDTMDQVAADFHLQLYSFDRLGDPVFEVVLPFYFASYLSHASVLSMLSVLLGIHGADYLSALGIDEISDFLGMGGLTALRELGFEDIAQILESKLLSPQFLIDMGFGNLANIQGIGNLTLRELMELVYTLTPEQLSAMGLSEPSQYSALSVLNNLAVNGLDSISELSALYGMSTLEQISAILDSSAMSLMEPIAASAFSVTGSWMKKDWYSFNLKDMALVPGSYQMKLRIKNDANIWSEWGIEEFAIEE